MSPNQVIRLIEIVSAAKDCSAGTIGRKASGSGDFHSRLKRGHDLTTRRAARVIQYLSDHWPSDLEWPCDIERPAPQKAAPQKAAPGESKPDTSSPGKDAA